MPLKPAVQRLTSLAGYYLPVKIRAGLAQGAWWTAYPHSAYWRKGGAEPEIEAVVRRHGCSPGGVSWDLGAHFGIYTVGMSLAVGAAGQVVAVEPDPASFRRLSRHVRLNCLQDVVRAINAGASDRSGNATLHLSQGAGATTSHFYYESETRSAHDRTLSVPIVALDDAVVSGSIRAPSFMKVDVEGHGAKALQGGAMTLRSCAPAILMSFHGGAEVTGARAILEPLRYRPITLDETAAAWPANDSNDTLLLLR